MSVERGDTESRYTSYTIMVQIASCQLASKSSRPLITIRAAYADAGVKPDDRLHRPLIEPGLAFRGIRMLTSTG